MVAVNSFRKFQRMHSGVMIHLRFDEWPGDVSLPAETTVAKTGEGPFHPYWDLILKSDRTIESVVGWFIFPLSLDAAIAWYQSEMAKCGWIELTEKGCRMPASAALHFEHPASKVRVVVGLRAGSERKVSDAFIRRIIEHPWSPVAEQPLELTAEIA
ncbi:hypothetical protein [Candidatus Amarolinea dominans]|uniref:hypothetical protein n=1 Tax=Candidatus Amarolinea dominans TaxID=3140696 RepID=UPI001DF3321D|nr:hypothetical protein [Anaerolineae bacterium]